MTRRRAGIYARISDDPEGTRLGVTRQLEDCRGLAEQRGWDVVEEYVDNDVSASSGKQRPAYERLLADLRAGRVDAVAVWSLDRLHRRPIELEHFLDLVKDRGTDLASVGGTVDLGTDQGVLTARITGAVAAQEAAAIGRRVRRKQQQNREEGRDSGGGKRKFGWEPDRLTPIPEEQDEIRRLAAAVLAGASTSGLARDLNARGVPTVSQTAAASSRSTQKPAPWSRNSVRAVLRSPRIAGLLTYKTEIVGPGAWDPVISREDYDRLQAALDTRRGPARASSNTRQHLLSGIAVCGAPGCGKGLQVKHQGRSQSRGEPVLSYRCPHGHVSRNMRFVDEYVVGRFLVHREEYRKQLALALVEAARAAESAPDLDPEALHAEIDALARRKEEARRQFADGEIDMGDWVWVRRRIEQHEAALEGQRQRVQSLDSTRSAVEALIAGPGEQEVENWSALPLDRQRHRLASALDRLVVHPTRNRGGGQGASRFDSGAIEVHWRWSTEDVEVTEALRALAGDLDDVEPPHLDL